MFIVNKDYHTRVSTDCVLYAVYMCVWPMTFVGTYHAASMFLLNLQAAETRVRTFAYLHDSLCSDVIKMFAERCKHGAIAALIQLM